MNKRSIFESIYSVSKTAISALAGYKVAEKMMDSDKSVESSVVLGTTVGVT